MSFEGPFIVLVWRVQLSLLPAIKDTVIDFILSWGLSAGTGKLCIFGILGLVFIWNCFVSFFDFFCFTWAYVICALVRTEGTLSCDISKSHRRSWSGSKKYFNAHQSMQKMWSAYISEHPDVKMTRLKRKKQRTCYKFFNI